MRIGFVAPLKGPDHPVPSGDRAMARLLLAALRQAGHTVTLLSALRTFTPTPDPAAVAAIAAAAADEVARIAAAWDLDPAGPPDLVFAYHLYYKAPDLIGVALARRFARPYATAEASHAGKRTTGPWAEGQARVDAAVRGAAVNLCFTANDRAGLAKIVPPDRLVDLPPFIDAAPETARPVRASGAPVEIVALAMMRPGDKLRSYAFLAEALRRVRSRDWRLTVAGDGPGRAAVEAAFAALPMDRVRFLGEVATAAVPAVLAGADLLAWPGFNEAFGLSYLEAQAAGLPVVAVSGEGTPSVVRHGETGLLTEPTEGAYAAALDRLLADPALRRRLGAAASRFVRQERTVERAAATLRAALATALQAPVAA